MKGKANKPPWWKLNMKDKRERSKLWIGKLLARIDGKWSYRVSTQNGRREGKDFYLSEVINLTNTQKTKGRCQRKVLSGMRFRTHDQRRAVREKGGTQVFSAWLFNLGFIIFLHMWQFSKNRSHTSDQRRLSWKIWLKSVFFLLCHCFYLCSKHSHRWHLPKYKQLDIVNLWFQKGVWWLNSCMDRTSEKARNPNTDLHIRAS